MAQTKSEEILGKINILRSNPDNTDYIPLFDGMIGFILAPHTFSMCEINSLMNMCTDSNSKSVISIV